MIDKASLQQIFKTKITLPTGYIIVLICASFFLITIIATILILIYKYKSKIFAQIQEQLLKKQKELEFQNKQLEEQLYKLKATSLGKTTESIWQREEMLFLFNLQEKLINIYQLDIASRIIVDEIYKFLNVHKVIILLLNNESKQLEFFAGCGIEQHKLKNFAVKSTESISGFVLTQNKPLLVENLDNEKYLKSINKEEYLSGNFISLPISLKNEIIGILHICAKKTAKPFLPSEFEFLKNLSRLIALIFKNIILYQQLNQNYLKTISAIAAAIDARDPYTKYHSENVTRYTIAIAKELQLPYKQIEVLQQAALLHDVGKIAVADQILRKESKLSDEEYQQIKIHPVKGQEILKSLDFLHEVALLIRHHHERFDGTGYPDKLKGHQIELGARIIAVADTFDAMTTDRPYRKALNLKEAIDELERIKNTQLDPEIVDSFIKILKNDPQIVRKC